MSICARLSFVLSLSLLTVVACSEEPDTTPGGPGSSGGDAGAVLTTDGGSSTGDAASIDGGAIRGDRFATEVVSFTPGECAGFGASAMPDIVLGPPVGSLQGAQRGSLHVVSLGIGGEIVLSFAPNAIVDGPGVDFIVFENAFYAAGNPNAPAADPGEVSVSEDGTTWMTYECLPGASAPYGKCAGWHPVFSAPDNGISPVDPEKAGGEAYDLAELGLTKARFVRIRDRSTGPCEGQPKPQNLGFDLDAIALVHAESL